MDKFQFDSRISRALPRLGITQPTPIQSAVIPIALNGADILGKAKTGSGKTAAYALPILHKLLSASGLEDVVCPVKTFLSIDTSYLPLCMCVSLISLGTSLA